MQIQRRSRPEKATVFEFLVAKSQATSNRISPKQRAFVDVRRSGRLSVADCSRSLIVVNIWPAGPQWVGFVFVSAPKQQLSSACRVVRGSRAADAHCRPKAGPVICRPASPGSVAKCQPGLAYREGTRSSPPRGGVVTSHI